MHLDSQADSDLTDHRAQRVVRRLAGRYLFVLVAVALLVVVDQAIVQPMLVHVNAFAPAINVAGRQRMLSQRLTKAALALGAADRQVDREARLDEFQTSLAQWTAEHDALVRGDATLGIRAIRTASLDAEWQRIDPHYSAMVDAGREIVESDGASTRAAAGSPTAVLVEHESQYLPTMDRIVKLMEGEADRAVFRLRAFALAIAILVVGLLIGLGWLVVWPATRTIRTQVDELESQVALRTAELATALASLQREVAEREAAELKTQRLAAQLTHAARVTTMGHLTAGLAHELNQPLAAITNYANACEVMLDQIPHSGPWERFRDVVVNTKRSALRAGQIVRRMRNFVRPNATVPAPVGLNSLVREIIELCRTEIAAARVDVQLELAPEELDVPADAIQIQQVLVNLVQNSLQSMHAMASPVRMITIRVSSSEESARIDVLDTGPGFPATDAEFAFAPFHSTKQDGLGIGLSICRSIVENHRGKIWTESPPGRGAQVTFTLPLAATHARLSRNQPDRLCC
jgi:C4-dicarboxylate-specific signal transduction histidine kinase